MTFFMHEDFCSLNQLQKLHLIKSQWKTLYVCYWGMKQNFNLNKQKVSTILAVSDQVEEDGEITTSAIICLGTIVFNRN